MQVGTVDISCLFDRDNYICAVTNIQYCTAILQGFQPSLTVILFLLSQSTLCSLKKEEKNSQRIVQKF